MTPSARYPTAVATASDLKIAANQRQSVLTLNMLAADMLAFVRDGTQFGSNMLVSIDQEILSVASVSGNQLTFNGRAFDGTTAAAHSAGAQVSVLIDAWHHNSTAAEIEAIEQTLGPNLQNVAVGGVTASVYNFAPQSPSGALIAGANTITLSPVPAGVNGSDVGHALYVSGTGTPEAATIIGGSGVAGSPSGQLIIQCANPHPAGWTIQSASGGLQEAICTLPAAGGTVQVTQALTLYANVGPCGKTDVQVNKLAGAMVTGAFTVLGNSISGFWGPVPTGNHAQTVKQNLVVGGPSPYADLRAYGAACDGVTNDYPALLAADAAGASAAFVPKNCLIKTDYLTTLTHIQRIVGEDWNTSVISTASDPTVTNISVPAGMVLEHLTLATFGCTAPGHKGPILFYHNARAVGGTTGGVDSPSYSAYNSFVVSVDNSQDLQGMGIRQYGTGDGLYTESMPGSAGWGIRARNSSTQGAALFENFANTGTAIETMDTGVTGATHITMYSTSKAGGGNWMLVSHNTSAFNGQVIQMDMAHGNGSFGGLFINCVNNLVQQMSVDFLGNLVIAGSLKTNGVTIHAGAGAPNGSVSGNPGDLWLNTSGGAATTLWVKESGAGTTSGWVGK